MTTALFMAKSLELSVQLLRAVCMIAIDLPLNAASGPGIKSLPWTLKAFFRGTLENFC
jgi:hypothetical protein